MKKIKNFITNHKVAMSASCLIIFLFFGIFQAFGSFTSIGENIRVLGGVQFNIGDKSRPACDQSNHGMMWIDKDNGDGDIVYFCTKHGNASVYEWVLTKRGIPSIDIYVPLGAEGYDMNGNLVIAEGQEGTLSSSRGQVVFKEAKNYGSVSISSGDFEVLIVAGGGGGGAGFTTSSSNRAGGGGGAGGLIYLEEISLSQGSYSVIVGAGGAVETQGGNSQFSNSIAIGGGYANAGDGGSGGGGGYDHRPGNSGTQGQGHDGGNGAMDRGGGGGGAAQAGQHVPDDKGGDGGDGLKYFGTYYAGGGGGGAGRNWDRGVGGKGGGGHGSISCTPYGPSDSTSGTNYLGGGGGGASASATGGCNFMAPSPGGSGIVIVRWGGYDFDYNPTI